MQEIYINLDDSGKLSKKELYSVYGGIVFLSKKEKDKFITQYRSIIDNIKCKYCDKCNNICPEIKNTNITNKDKRRIMNYLKKYYVVGLVISNKKVYKHIMDNKRAKGRFLDYALRRLIKEIINECLVNKLIDANEDLRIIINIDEQPTKTNGYYNLHDGIYEELKYGISNFNYGGIYKPLINGDLEVKVCYQDSKKSYLVQASDLISGTIRKEVTLDNDISNLVDLRINIP